MFRNSRSMKRARVYVPGKAEQDLKSSQGHADVQVVYQLAIGVSQHFCEAISKPCPGLTVTTKKGEKGECQ